MPFKDTLAIVGSVVAILISVVSFFRENLFGQHVLRASVVAIDPTSSNGKLKASLLVVNAGKHTEVLYRARFIFSANLNNSGGAASKESVGPIVLDPGKAVVIDLETAKPRSDELRRQRAFDESASSVHVGVIFDALTPSGELREDSKIYRITDLTYAGEQLVGAKPKDTDSTGLIDLL